MGAGLGCTSAVWAFLDDILSGDLGAYSTAYPNAPIEFQSSFPSPSLLYLASIGIQLGGLAALAGAVLIFLKKEVAATVAITAGGMLLASATLYIIAIAQAPSDDAPFGHVKFFALIAGILIAVAGVYTFRSQIKHVPGGRGANGKGNVGPPTSRFGQPPHGYQPPPQQPGGYGQPQ